MGQPQTSAPSIATSPPCTIQVLLSGLSQATSLRKSSSPASVCSRECLRIEGPLVTGDLSTDSRTWSRLPEPAKTKQAFFLLT